MSRFHFDENAASAVSTSLSGIAENINTCKEQLNSVLNDLQYYEGFNIEYAIEQVNEEKSRKLPNCKENVTNAISTINSVKEKVVTFSKLANSQKSLSIIDYVNNNKQYKIYNNVFRKYNSETAEFINKYYGFGTVISQIKTAFGETFKSGSYEKYLIKKSIKDIIGTASGDYKFSTPIDDLMNGAGDINTLMSAFNEQYKSNPINKIYKEAKYDAKIIVSLANDYSNNLEYLNSLERSLISSGYDKRVIKDVMNEIRNDYNNKYLEAAEDVLSYGLETIVKEGIKMNPIGKTVLTTLDIMEMVDKSGEDKMNYAAILNYEKEAFNSYERLAEKIHSNTFTEQDLVDYNNMFEICRNMEINKYKAASSFVDKEDYKICQEAIKFYENLSL